MIGLERSTQRDSTRRIRHDDEPASRRRAGGEVREWQWLAEHWQPGSGPPGVHRGGRRRRLGPPDWPRERSAGTCPKELAPTSTEEFAGPGRPGPDTTASAHRRQRPSRTSPSRPSCAAPVLRKLLTGEYRTCLLYSEPGAGSDLAGLQTRADRDGDEWVVNGQKVWTSGARKATHGLLAARTNWDVPKRRGITYFLLPMRQDRRRDPAHQADDRAPDLQRGVLHQRPRARTPCASAPSKTAGGSSTRPGRRADEHGRRPAPGPGGPSPEPRPGRRPSRGRPLRCDGAGGAGHDRQPDRTRRRPGHAPGHRPHPRPAPYRDLERRAGRGRSRHEHCHRAQAGHVRRTARLRAHPRPAPRPGVDAGGGRRQLERG